MRLGTALRLLLPLLLVLPFVQCREDPGSSGPPERLSSYGLFEGPLAELRPADDVLPYDINTPLFSDYAQKDRLVRLPPGTAISYRPRGPFYFPVGTVIAKTFSYPADFRDPSSRRRILETRLLIREPDGWVGLPYVWNEEQTEARLELTGGRIAVAWIDRHGAQIEHDYMVPNVNQCKGCHRPAGRAMAPLGPQAAQLNRELLYAAGPDNQLDRWAELDLLRGAPPSPEAPRLPVWNDPGTGTVESRARAWLDINCAHCHNPEGPARTTGLDLSYAQTDPTKLGVYKHPVAAGRGSGDSLYGIVPGRPEDSILVFRLRSLDPGVMMPELGRGLVHHETLELVEEWIRRMPERSPGPVAAALPAGPRGAGPGARSRLSPPTAELSPASARAR